MGERWLKTARMTEDEKHKEIEKIAASLKLV